MATQNLISFRAVALACLVILSSTYGDPEPSVHEESQRTTYIIRVRPPVSFSDDTAGLDLKHWYESFLPLEPMSKETGTDARPSLLHTYRAAMTGFAAKLTEAEAASLAAKDDVLGVFPRRRVALQTTHSPEFMGLRATAMYGNSHSAWNGALGRMVEGVIIAHVSFRDDGMRAPPAKWHGKCDFWGGRKRCNKKIVGGRTIFHSLKDGHGTHTASTASGNFVAGASVLGNGNGTAAGMAPRAHLAVYEVCDRVFNSDGADVLSLSFGDDHIKPFYQDTIAIGAFNAMKKGIFVSCSAGNSGPDPGFLMNDAPWILTVGAGTMDRQMQAVVRLGNGQTFVGESAYQPHGLLPDPECQPLTGVAGKIIDIEDVCDDMVQTGILVKDSGGAGMVLTGEEEDGNTSYTDAHVLPASYVTYKEGIVIRKYMKTTENPVAAITFHGTSFSASTAPAVASLSSRGPSLTTPNIRGEKRQGGGIGDFSDVTFNILSGTSMSTPHLSGIAALIKSEHPDWSPAMIKSAIMTTADTVRSDGKPILDEKLKTAGAFDMGAGHVNPSKAVNPGLVYDIDEAQYIAYICGLGFTEEQVEIITHKRNICRSISKITGAELNYPSIVTQASGKITVNRMLTSVDNSHGKYRVEVSVPNGVVVKVSPSVLEFGGLNDKKIFNIKMSWDPLKTKQVEGSLKWISKTHVVRIPVTAF
ncbi:hypothetical protein PVAP13_4KG239200 [Panicum virgatum]|uniref:Uncharacterized protein n=1 Tax=Panicum virgatum TaxID=38727 RepID=A0A8T0TJ79_PANVG|nr:hypothetical protein PVAP13_4KG239200 [Panicum virgatum]